MVNFITSLVQVLNKDEDIHWFKAELEGREGFVPSNYIRMQEHDWYVLLGDIFDIFRTI